MLENRWQVWLSLCYGTSSANIGCTFPFSSGYFIISAFGMESFPRQKQGHVLQIGSSQYSREDRLFQSPSLLPLLFDLPPAERMSMVCWITCVLSVVDIVWKNSRMSATQDILRSKGETALCLPRAHTYRGQKKEERGLWRSCWLFLSTKCWCSLCIIVYQHLEINVSLSLCIAA